MINRVISARLWMNLSKAVLLVVSLFVGMHAAADTPGADAKQPLRILYIGGDEGVFGGPGPQRAADFKQFLEKHFVAVSTVKGSDFKPEQAKDADVIVKDA